MIVSAAMIPVTVSAGVASICALPPSDMLAWWQAEQGFDDSSSGGHSGNPAGDVSRVSGRTGMAYQFDGDGDYIDFGNVDDFDLDDFTLSAWVYVDPLTNTGHVRVLSRDDWPQTAQRDLVSLKSSEAQCAGSNNSPALGVMVDGVFACAVASEPLTAGWHHLAGVRAGQSVSLYVDGQLAAQVQNGPEGTIAPNAPLVAGSIGSDQPVPAVGENFTGLLDEMRLYGRALSEEEIRSLMHYGDSALVELSSRAVGADGQPRDLLFGDADRKESDFVSADGKLFFVGKTSTEGQELWVASQGANCGYTLRLVKDINLGAANSDIRDLVAMGSEVLFFADDSSGGGQLWRSDGTAAGTFRVKKTAGSLDYLTVVNRRLYFRELNGGIAWVSDGTEQGSHPVVDAPLVGWASNEYSHRSPFLSFGGHDFIQPRIQRMAFWEVVDGKAVSAINVSGLSLFTNNSPTFPSQIQAFDGRWLFSASTDNDYELWKAEPLVPGGVPEFVEQVMNINSGTTPSYPAHFLPRAMGGANLYFTAVQAGVNGGKRGL